MTTKEKVIGGIGALALILALVGLVGSNQSVSLSGEQVDQIVEAVSFRLQGISFGREGTEFQHGITANKLFISSLDSSKKPTATTTITGWQRGIIKTAGDRDFYQNNTGTEQCYDLGVMKTNGTASSTVTLYMFGATTTLVTAHDYDALVLYESLVGRNLISESVPTSTTATTTSSLNDADSEKVVCIKNGEYLSVYAQSVCRLQGQCEQSTSTALGIHPIEWFARSFATSTNE